MRYTKCRIILVAGLLALGPVASAKNPSEAKTERDRLENAGKVMQEILHVPDDIPQDLIDKARCVVVMPSVLKAAFVVGGSYGRGLGRIYPPPPDQRDARLQPIRMLTCVRRF